jgi:1-aminocyclopropane-1-carboxylate deaminase/D-cysteine desulfhydrase-like pyridoxal-dependent ACC family enzyme
MRLKLQRPGNGRALDPGERLNDSDLSQGADTLVSIGGVQSIPGDSSVLYAHLGGQPALNAYSGVFR